MNARIQDVAREAGVSTATVSRALRGLPNVSEQTRRTVSQVASELGYVVSRSASRLATGRTLAIAVIAPYVERWFYAQLVSAIEGELRQSGFDALLIGIAEPEDTDRDPFDPATLRGRVDGVVVLTVPLTGAELDGLRSLGLPTVFVGAAVSGSMSVRIDDVAVARVATEHLLQLGHRRIAYVGGDPRQRINFTAPVDRRAGWLAALREAGIEPDPSWEVPGQFTATGGFAAGNTLLDLPEPPTAVFCASDDMASGLLLAVRGRGLKVPEDLSILGVDGTEMAQLLDLSTVAQPVRKQGEIAARMVLQALRGEQRHRLEHAVLPVVLVERGSTAAGPFVR
ncbi:MAG: transcriptional regulator, laci family protein [Frankiales bacterium]|jgi:LacI family repressor for deo operon, udp, cdd, tsx, nupC, and nupG|nr:transcriptional regulator, laci family protein [Frankiales bacterium]MCW2708714.1 transcriptional regulator, laci family protein [Frankiales bacterium]